MTTRSIPELSFCSSATTVVPPEMGWLAALSTTVPLIDDDVRVTSPACRTGFPELPVAFCDDRLTRIEIDIEIFCFAGRDDELSAGNLARWNLDAGRRLAREQQRLRLIRGA